ASLLLAGGWFAYLFSWFGVGPTLTANTTTGSYYADMMLGTVSERPGWLRVFANNLAMDLVPCAYHDGALPPCPSCEQVHVTHGNTQRYQVEIWRFYTNYAGGILGVSQWSGLALGALALLIGLRPIRHEGLRGVFGSRFWLLLFALGIPLSVVPVRWLCPYGT